MIEIRLLRPDDPLDDLVRLSTDFFSEYENHHPEFFKIDDLKNKHIHAYFARFTQDENKIAFIALDGERIIAYICAYIKPQADFWVVKRLGEISGLMVAESYRSAGIGEKLFKHALDFFTQKGVQYYNVYTAVANQGAIDFYLENGMEPLYTTLVGEIK